MKSMKSEKICHVSQITGTYTAVKSLKKQNTISLQVASACWLPVVRSIGG
jgi:hypothetical protein